MLGVPTYKKIQKILLGDTYIFRTIYRKDMKNLKLFKIWPRPSMHEKVTFGRFENQNFWESPIKNRSGHP